MKTKRPLLLVLGLLLLPGCQKKGPPTDYSALVIPDTVTLMDYNVENMFDFTNNGSEYPEFIPGACNWTREIQQTKVANIAGVICAARPDIAVFEEIENRAAASQLQQELTKMKWPMPYVAYGDRPNPTNTIPVIFSRFPILWSQGVGMPRETRYFTRNLLECAVYLGADTLIVFACHWPSKNNPESKRLAIARSSRASRRTP
jgi:hypothetical protein